MKRLLLLLVPIALLAGCQKTYPDSEAAYFACLEFEMEKKVDRTRCRSARSSKPHYKTEFRGKDYRFYY